MKQTIKKAVIKIACACWLVTGVGCGEPQAARPARADTTGTTKASDSVALRFQEGASHTQSVVQSAMDLSKKYSALSEEAANLRQTKQDLESQNAALKQKITSLQQDLTRCQSELNQSNDLLMDMLGELNQWKSDVLGFRHEMRDSAKAQMSALLKILKMMGAEVNDVTPSIPDSNEPSK